MKAVHGTLVSGYVGAPGSLKKTECDTLEFAFDGIVGDRHRGFTRAAWDLTDKQPGGTERRNERQWSAVAHEDLAAVSKQLGLPAALRAGDVAVNLSISGVPELSRLPRGTVLTFEGGVVLIVEEYNPPCSRMSQHIADHYHRVNEELFVDSVVMISDVLRHSAAGRIVFFDDQHHATLKGQYRSPW